MTRLAVSGLTSARVFGLRAREAVPACTPARRATSLSVIGLIAIYKLYRSNEC
jgi:hypothetical protein